MEEMDILVILDLNAESAEDVITSLGSLLERNGFVKPTFIPATLEREKSVPTGLELQGGINAALPHAGVEHVNRPALVVARLKKEVLFRKMDDPEASIPVKLVFMPAIKDPHSYITTLMKLVDVFKDPETVKKLVEAKSEEEVVEILKEKLVSE